MTLRVASVVVFAASWELLATAVDSLLLPSFTETVAALGRLLVSSELWQAAWISNQAMVLGFFLAAAIGIPIGLLMGRCRAVERFIDPYLSILLATPKSALIPIVIMATGLGLQSRVLVTSLFALPVITVNTRAGVRLIDPAWIDMARSFGATERQLWRRILLRGVFPAMLAGLRLGLARSVAGMVTVELLLVALGFGRLILYYQATFDAPSLYAAILALVIEAVLLLRACGWLEKRMTQWAGEAVGA